MTTRGRLLLLALLVGGGGVAILAAGRNGITADSTGTLGGATAAAPPARETVWAIGQRRPNGLRIVPAGRADAAAVLAPAQFADSATRHAYWVATQIPAVLNQLYCWCGCENRGEHRSALGCFEDRMGVDCQVCQGTAEIAYRLVQQGEADAGRIQTAVDARWAPPGA